MDIISLILKKSPNGGPDFLELLLKIFHLLKPVFLVLFLIIVIWVGYRSIGYLIYLYLGKKIGSKDLDAFIDYLGTDYKYKYLSNGDKRYKWKKGIIIIKGNFDEDGKLIVNKPEPFVFFSFHTTVSYK